MRSWKDYLIEFSFNQPASRDNITEVERILGIEFPIDYVEFLLYSNGGEGGMGEEDYLRLWPVEDLIKVCRDWWEGRPHFVGKVFPIGKNAATGIYAYYEGQIVELDDYERNMERLREPYLRCESLTELMRILSEGEE